MTKIIKIIVTIAAVITATAGIILFTIKKYDTKKQTNNTI